METQVKTPSLAELATAVVALTARIEALEAKSNGSAKSQKEMTDDDARRVLNGDCKDMKHNDAGTKLGLSYGQVYSCRLNYTFRHIHKELSEKGWKNPWTAKKS